MSERKTMVCVTVQKTCERLILRGASIAQGAGLCVLHVAREGESLLGGQNDGEALDYLYRISRAYGAEMEVVRAKDVVDAIAKHAAASGVTCVVLGASGKRGGNSLSSKLRARLPGVAIEVE